LSFTRVNPGGWVSNDLITVAQINGIDVNQSRAVDGTGGGVYTPSADIDIDGTEGLVVSADSGLTVTGTAGLIVSGTNTGLTCSASGGAAFSGAGAVAISCTNGATVSGAGTLTASCTGGLVVSGAGGITLSTAGANITLASRSVTRTQSLAGAPDLLFANWVSNGVDWYNGNTGAGLFLFMDRLPHAGVITSVTVKYEGATGHAAFPGGAPATMPSLELIKVGSLGSTSSIGTVSDTSASAGVYEAAHAITISGLSETTDLTTDRYVLVFTAESGINSIAGGVIYQASATCTVTGYKEF
jgi:hypothetical protein